jgi:hypothetical protein
VPQVSRHGMGYRSYHPLIYQLFPFRNTQRVPVHDPCTHNREGRCLIFVYHTYSTRSVCYSLNTLSTIGGYSANRSCSSCSCFFRCFLFLILTRTILAESLMTPSYWWKRSKWLNPVSCGSSSRISRIEWRPSYHTIHRPYDPNASGRPPK